jgi:phosphoglycolate phosphatase-like HAD superfamily hydrolase
VNNLSQIQATEISFSRPTTLALDFDGVICNGMPEYLATSWETYCIIWQVANKEMPDGLSDRFTKYRPLIETGWEMPVLIRALVLDIPDVEISQKWSDVRQRILAENNLNSQEVAFKLDSFRDEWIARDLESWLVLHTFYPGIVEQLKAVLQTEIKLVIITTKEGRFVSKILQKSGINLDRKYIFGKEQNQPKAKTLKQLLALKPDEKIWFIEDRWQTLQKIAVDPDLLGVKLSLADWGYNTEAERHLAQIDSRIQLISLANFSQFDFG